MLNTTIRKVLKIKGGINYRLLSKTYLHLARLYILSDKTDKVYRNIFLASNTIRKLSDSYIIKHSTLMLCLAPLHYKNKDLKTILNLNYALYLIYSASLPLKIFWEHLSVPPVSNASLFTLYLITESYYEFPLTIEGVLVHMQQEEVAHLIDDEFIKYLIYKAQNQSIKIPSNLQLESLETLVHKLYWNVVEKMYDPEAAKVTSKKILENWPLRNVELYKNCTNFIRNYLANKSVGILNVLELNCNVGGFGIELQNLFQNSTAAVNLVGVENSSKTITIAQTRTIKDNNKQRVYSYLIAEDITCFLCYAYSNLLPSLSKFTDSYASLPATYCIITALRTLSLTGEAPNMLKYMLKLLDNNGLILLSVFLLAGTIFEKKDKIEKRQTGNIVDIQVDLLLQQDYIVDPYYDVVYYNDRYLEKIFTQNNLKILNKVVYKTTLFNNNNAEVFEVCYILTNEPSFC